jgi:hypothetical protein
MDVNKILELVEKKYPSTHEGFLQLHFYADGSGYIELGGAYRYGFDSVEELIEHLEES